MSASLRESKRLAPKSHQGAELLITDSCILIFYLIIYNEKASLISSALNQDDFPVCQKQPLSASGDLFFDMQT